jgi:hypothetical protein
LSQAINSIFLVFAKTFAQCVLMNGKQTSLTGHEYVVISPNMGPFRPVEVAQVPPKFGQFST